jgi:hypothetical protein
MLLGGRVISMAGRTAVDGRRHATRVAVVALALLAGACGDDGGDDAGREDAAAGTTTSASAGAAETMDTKDTAATGQAQPLPTPGIGLLEAERTYLTAGFQPPLTFTSPGAWQYLDEPGALMLTPDSDLSRASRMVQLYALDTASVFDAFVLHQGAMQDPGGAQLRPVPDDFVASLREAPGLEMGTSGTPIEVAGHGGELFDFAVADVPDEPASCELAGGPCLAILQPEARNVQLVFLEGTTGSLAVLEGDEGRLLLIIEANEASLEEFRTEAEDLLASMVF